MDEKIVSSKKVNPLAIGLTHSTEAVSVAKAVQPRSPLNWVKFAALLAFTLLPFVAFYLGIRYYETTAKVEDYDLQTKWNQLNSPRFQDPINYED